MHRQFRALLEKAQGQSEFVIAVNLDIRGFSDWSRRVESVEAALYLRKIYPLLIDRFFADDWFFKPTGDGLLLVRPFEEAQLAELVTQTVTNCLEIVSEFPALLEDDPMVDFETPSAVGIGVARGAASRLAAGDQTLDYSGRVLNLASRLMEVARPRGLVCDARFSDGLLPTEVDDQFESTTVYLPGVSPDDPMEIRFVPAYTTILDTFRRPVSERTWETETHKTTLKGIEDNLPSRWRIPLAKVPTDASAIRCTVIRPAISPTGKRLDPTKTFTEFPDFKYELDADRPVVSVNYPTLAPLLRDAGVKGPWPVVIQVKYPVPPEPSE